MTAMRVLISWLYINTKSVLIAQLMHIGSTGSLVIFSPPAVSASQEVTMVRTLRNRPLDRRPHRSKKIRHPPLALSASVKRLPAHPVNYLGVAFIQQARAALHYHNVLVCSCPEAA
jgi:hypothetical protein